MPDGLAATILARLQVDRADVEAELGRRGPPAASTPRGSRRWASTWRRCGARPRRRSGRARSTARTPRGAAGSGGHIPFERDAKKALELGLREAVRLGHGFIGTEHLLLGLLHDGRARDVLVARGVGLDGTRALVEELVRKRQAG